MSLLTKTTKAQPDRDLTDASLRAERRNSDETIAEKLADAAADAAQLVAVARENADAVLSEARDKADQQLDADAGNAVVARDVVVTERDAQDALVRDERRVADAAIRRERDEELRALMKLLPLERAKTDRSLVTERARSDDDIAIRDDFLGMVSHDVRNLLSGIVLTAAATSEHGDSSQHIRTNMARVHRYAARMNRLVGDLIDVVSMEAGKLDVKPERGDVGALIAEAIDAFAPIAAEQGVALVVERVEDPLVGHFDHERVLQVLANLISNALKFTPRGGQVTVRAASRTGVVQLSVQDTGVGIPAEMLEAVFERFWQQTKADRRGTGLGLYISKSIVEAHGGRIWVESSLGDGSVFYVTLPVSS